MQYLREHLGPGLYEWNNKLKFNGNPSRRLYNRVDGNQLLFIINQFAATVSTFNINTVVTIQNMLMYELPLEAKSELSIMKWLNQRVID